MEPHPAVILDDLVEIVKRNGCGPCQQAPGSDDQQTFQQQHFLRSSQSSLPTVRVVAQAVSDPSLRSGFRRKAPAPLTPSKRLNFSNSISKLSFVPKSN
jgi:hypothetical protein